LKDRILLWLFPGFHLQEHLGTHPWLPFTCVSRRVGLDPLSCYFPQLTSAESSCTWCMPNKYVHLRGLYYLT
jgi:hypothetical protein